MIDAVAFTHGGKVGVGMLEEVIGGEVLNFF